MRIYDDRCGWVANIKNNNIRVWDFFTDGSVYEVATSNDAEEVSISILVSDLHRQGWIGNINHTQPARLINNVGVLAGNGHIQGAPRGIHRATKDRRGRVGNVVDLESGRSIRQISKAAHQLKALNRSRRCPVGYKDRRGWVRHIKDP